MSTSAETFHWTETPRVVMDLLGIDSLAAAGRAPHRLAVDGNGKRLLGEVEGEGAVEVVVPPVLPIEPGIRSGADYLATLPPELGRELVLLLQAGAAALGLWEADELVAHKVIKKYVVRGKGRAQPSHLKTKGKSRYGSRLRLRNAQALLDETNAKLHEWVDEHGVFGRVFASIPVRTLPELLAADPPPPFERDRTPTFWNKVPLDVRVPSFAELQRVRWALAHGRVVRHS